MAGTGPSRRGILAGGGAAAAAALLPRTARAAPRIILNDASGLNPTPVTRHAVLPTGSTDALIEAVRAEIRDAAAAGRPVAVGVARHSMGAQSLARDGTAVTLEGGPIEPDTAAGLYRVGAGARWSQVIRQLDRIGYSPTVMQSNSDFGVGSTFCVNAHGWPAPHGPFGSTVRALRLVLADGSLVTCSREENAELFGLAMGGYGLFGIVVDLVVEMVPNRLLTPTFAVMPAADFAPAFAAAVARDARLRMAYGRLSVAQPGFFDEAILVTYAETEHPPQVLPAAAAQGAFSAVSREIYRAQVGSEFGKRARWIAETRLNPTLDPGLATRNSLMNEPVANLASRDRSRTDILHEYFVPPERFDAFLAACRETIPRSGCDCLNVTLRYVAADPDSTLAYAPGPRIGAVMSFSQGLTPGDEAAMMRMTEALIERVVAIGGAYYLPYRLHARRDQMARAYSKLDAFVAAKRRYDPGLLFRNALWSTYMA
ncbi:FAD-binding oxidoreductase [Methylobacterium sp. OT2]|uniref:FAD-binding oxidoreductase n=1 Tax=Methylobacterium sp. OT2 TaxID=2813779 RepID=UPI00197B1FF7|nr:FAD-binding oxidoreductase [Methylobacterium sp. OT2]MBN4094950.1 FAD-binding oxidoreductase [Methylobacterium sp. OT2]